MRGGVCTLNNENNNCSLVMGEPFGVKAFEGVWLY